MSANQYQNTAEIQQLTGSPSPCHVPTDPCLPQVPRSSQATSSGQGGNTDQNITKYPFQRYQTFPTTSDTRLEDRPEYPNSQDSRHCLERESSRQSNLPENESILSRALDFTLQINSAPSHISSLDRPIAIPQLTHGRGQAFLRAWAPCLQAFNISQTEFLAFIDNLNIVSTASPSLQVLDLAGGIIGMVPYHWAQITGTAIQATAKLGVAAVSKSRTDMYTKEVNERMFKPRGLRASISSTEVMRSILRVPPTYPVLAPANAETIQVSTRGKALVALAPFNAVLDLNVPPPAEQTTLLASLSAGQVVRQEHRTQKKLVKEREKTLEKAAKRERKDEEKATKKERKRGKKGRKKERTHGRKSESSDSGSSGSDEGQAGESLRKQEKKEKVGKEEKNIKKVLWIVVENL